MGEGEVDLEVEACLPLLSNHPGMLQGRLTEDKSLPHVIYFTKGCPFAKSEPNDGGDEHQGDSL